MISEKAKLRLAFLFDLSTTLNIMLSSSKQANLNYALIYTLRMGLYVFNLRTWKRVGVSRTTLLYYEKLGVIRGQRLDNGYRLYTELDAQRLTLAIQLQDGGLSL